MGGHGGADYHLMDAFVSAVAVSKIIHTIYMCCTQWGEEVLVSEAVVLFLFICGCIAPLRTWYVCVCRTTIHPWSVRAQRRHWWATFWCLKQSDLGWRAGWCTAEEREKNGKTACKSSLPKINIMNDLVHIMTNKGPNLRSSVSEKVIYFNCFCSKALCYLYQFPQIVLNVFISFLTWRDWLDIDVKSKQINRSVCLCFWCIHVYAKYAFCEVLFKFIVVIHFIYIYTLS